MGLNNDSDNPVEVCKCCNETKNLNAIMKHLAMKANCKAQYSEQELVTLQATIRNHRKARRSKKSNTNIVNEESNQEKIQCKICKEVCWINTIRRHLAKNPNCKAGYSTRELHVIDKRFSNYEKTKRSTKKKLRREANQSEPTFKMDTGVSFN